MSISSRRNDVPHLALLAAVTGASFFILGAGGILLSGAHPGVAIIWPATALGMCLLLRLSRNRVQDITMLAAILAGGLLANGVTGAPLPLNIAYSIVNVVDVVAGIAAMRSFSLPRFRSPQSTIRFFLAAGVAPSLLGAALAGGVTFLFGGGAALAAGIHWFLANLLGILMVFPFAMSVSVRQFVKLQLERRFFEALGVFSALTAVSVLAFHVSSYPLHFLVLAMTCIAAARFRLMGTGAALFIICVIALAPHPGVTAGNPVARIELLQIFLATCSLIGVRVALVLNERDLHLAVIEGRRRRAARASRFKSQLLSHVSHEVRSPLSAIIGFSAMLESGALPAERAQEFAHVIAHNGELLQRLHDDLLDLSRAEAGALSLQSQRVPVAAALKICIGAIRLDASLGGKAVVIEDMEDSLAVHADPVRLAQVINNLIANAYKYGDNYSPIRVRASRLNDGFGRIEIANAGPGIAARDREAVFRPFGRLHLAGRRVPGAGLGLSIAKLLVERQGGRIDFESIPGRQTRFWIDLPLAA